MDKIQSTEDRAAGNIDQSHGASGCSAHPSEPGAFTAGTRRVPHSDWPGGDPERLEVMIVDDDAVVLQLVKRIFESFGYEVATANGSAEAMADLSVKQYDLVLTDLEMPGMNGYRLGMCVKADSPATRVVIMTGRCRTDIPHSMTDGSMDGWIFKPFGLADMCNTLERLGFPHPSRCAS
jgi:CheY-like chemotaxis protein